MNQTDQACPLKICKQRCLAFLARWMPYSNRHWYSLPGQPGLGCYGTGYNAWGVQTNQKYIAAAATLALSDPTSSAAAEAGARAEAALRFSLRSHGSGDLRCTDGTAWGRTWISALGIERMMSAVDRLLPRLDRDCSESLERVLCSEADWLLRDYHRGRPPGIRACLWNRDGGNHPESNLWNGALLWRTASRYPDHPHADAWRERAHVFLINALSVPADAENERIVAGKPVRERFRGANFFPNFALDHHGYLNVGYMVICLSNAAFLHFDAENAGWKAPETLYHNQKALWLTVRRLIFGNGRLARLGGDTRVRYAYCQDYLLPALVYAADAFGDPHALSLLERQLDWIGIEQEAGGDGGFYSARLSAMRRTSPYYYTRLESDRACALALSFLYLDQAQRKVPLRQAARAVPSFETEVAGHWHEPQHGAVMHRCPTRLASFSWRAAGLAQGLCLPPGDGHLAEWLFNLVGRIRFNGSEPWTSEPGRHRAIVRARTRTFPGGFAAWGSLHEGLNLSIDEGWRREQPGAIHQLAVMALPDEHTMLGFQFARSASVRLFVECVDGLRLNLPNDLFNGFKRRITREGRTLTLKAPPAKPLDQTLQSPWVCIDGRLSVIGLYGDRSLRLSASPAREGGPYACLYLAQISWGGRHDGAEAPYAVDPDTVLCDLGWAISASCPAAEARNFQRRVRVRLAGDLRWAAVTGLDGRRYLAGVNLGSSPHLLEASELSALAGRAGATFVHPEKAGFPYPVEPGEPVLLTIP